MVEGRYQHAARLLQKFGGDLLALTGAAQHHVRAVVTGGLHLDARGLARHDDVRVDPERGGGVGDRLGVISAGVRDHAPRAIGVCQVADGVEGAANLEGADRLQVLRLDPQRALASAHRAGISGVRTTASADPVGRRLDVLEGDQLHGFSVPVSR